MSWNNLNTKKQSIAVTVPVEDYEHLTGKRLEDAIRENLSILVTTLVLQTVSSLYSYPLNNHVSYK